MNCEKHRQVKAPGLCPICLIEERDQLSGRCERLSEWVDHYKTEIERLRVALQQVVVGADAERNWPDNPCGPAWQDIYDIASGALRKE
jgi:hypothetical protein